MPFIFSSYAFTLHLIHTHVANSVPFSETPGVVPNMSGKEPIDFFNLLFDEEIKEIIHTETCLHADRYFSDNKEYLLQHPSARAHDWAKNPMSLKEVDVLLAMVIGMGIVGLPTLR